VDTPAITSTVTPEPCRVQAIVVTPSSGARGATLYIHIYVVFRAGEHIEIQLEDGGAEEQCALSSRGQSSSSKDAQAFSVGYVVLGCMRSLAEL